MSLAGPMHNLLNKKQLLIVFSSLASALFICYADQNGIGTILPTVGRDFHAANTISWAGTSSLIANTVTQVMYARISDIYGRKPVFLFSVGMLVLADVLCGVAPDAPSFYFFRALVSPLSRVIRDDSYVCLSICLYGQRPMLSLNETNALCE